MKYAILSDIHANLEALDAVLRDQKELGCTHMACLGDIVGYGPDPKEFLDIIRALGMPVVQGNWDQYAGIDGNPFSGLNEKFESEVFWTRHQLTAEDREWLQNLPLILIQDGFTMVHATLDKPHRWEYIFDRLAAAASFSHQKLDVCFFGHTHIPIGYIKDTVVRGGTFNTIHIKSGPKYFVNPGSVGQPRDGDTRAAYIIFDLEACRIELRRVDYDISITRDKIRSRKR